ncbi:hypothetical protein HYC85_002238 [Camellia sinensis]|uniref:Uncharacterized protein n=1 Tax=Camellia sinensis TaxID=4442 RepID=A0A7J7I7Y6_CAMSI|nr:hypothetical protein HYC85_002238 [Camellia sinensis]
MATKIDNDISRIEKGAITSTNSDSKKDDSFWTSTTVVVTFQKGDCRGDRYVFCDLHRLWIGCRQQVIRRHSYISRDMCNMGTNSDGNGLLGRSHIWGSFQSGGHHHFRHLSPVSMVPLYIAAQLMGSVLGSCTLSLIFEVTSEAYFGTVPAGSNLQSFVLEFIISFLLMFVISGVATDNRSVGELAGIAVGMTITLNVFVAGPISGASMNPARSIGPAMVNHVYKGLWVYIIGPLCGTIAGGFTYNLIRFTDRPLCELTKSSSFLRSLSKSCIWFIDLEAKCE